MGVAALVFGILGLVTCWVPFLGIALSLIGVILGVVNMIKKSGNKAFGIIGIVVGGVGMILAIVLTIIMWAGAELATDIYDDYQMQNAPAESPFSQ